MKKWIYLKSYNLADALALATILKDAEGNFHVVRQSFNSFIFSGLTNVTIDFYKKGEELTEIGPIIESSWIKKCMYISKVLGIKTKEQYKPYSSRSLTNLYQENLLQNKYALLYLFPTSQWNLDLILIDQVVRTFEQQQLEFISGGSNVIPCINGTKDYRQLIDMAMIGKMKDNITFILTTETFMYTIGEAFNIKVFVLSYDNGLTINDYPMNDANQIVNFIMSNI